jgi:ribosomal protein S18 acetylase RimI-like enzyme
VIYRIATQADVPLLAELNHRLIRDEGHRNPMTVPQLAERMSKWIEAEYTAIVFEEENEVVAYTLHRNSSDGIYLRQLFVHRDSRRRGIGRRAIHLLFREIWPRDKRITVEVLTHNAVALNFWRAVGFLDYSITLEKLPG